MGSSNLKTAFWVSRSRGELSLLWQSGPVLTAPEEFVNAALFLRLGLPSTLVHHENAALFLRLHLPSRLIRHENAALFLRLDLPSTLIRHENGAFQKTLFKPEEFENAGISFSCGQWTLFKNGAVGKRWCHDNHVIFLSEFSSSSKTQGLLAGTMQYFWVKVYFKSWRAEFRPADWAEKCFSAQSVMRSSRVTLSPSYMK